MVISFCVRWYELNLAVYLLSPNPFLDQGNIGRELLIWWTLPTTLLPNDSEGE